jgi:hypothetical protein
MIQRQATDSLRLMTPVQRCSFMQTNYPDAAIASSGCQSSFPASQAHEDQRHTTSLSLRSQADESPVHTACQENQYLNSKILAEMISQRQYVEEVTAILISTLPSITAAEIMTVRCQLASRAAGRG